MYNNYGNPYGNYPASQWGTNPPYGPQPFQRPNNLVNYQQPGQPTNNQAAPASPVNNIPQNGLVGRVVDNENDIVYAEIPQDGVIAYFPSRDLSCIFAKQVGQNGVATTIRYVPEQIKETEQVTYDEANVMNLLSNVLSELDDIKGMVRKQYRPHHKPYKKNQNGSRYNKEGVTNE